jgi:hypothetical protein
MQHDVFEFIFVEQMKMCRDTLIQKGKEYSSDDDKLHNFKISAKLQGITPIEALRGKMAKHTVSLYDMINSKKIFPPEVWTEKITDHMNYLILLQALLYEDVQVRLISRQREKESEHA